MACLNRACRSRSVAAEASTSVITTNPDSDVAGTGSVGAPRKKVNVPPSSPPVLAGTKVSTSWPVPHCIARAIPIVAGDVEQLVGTECHSRQLYDVAREITNGVFGRRVKFDDAAVTPTGHQDPTIVGEEHGTRA